MATWGLSDVPARRQCQHGDSASTATVPELAELLRNDQALNVTQDEWFIEPRGAYLADA